MTSVLGIFNPEILGPIVGIIFTKMYYLIDFKHFKHG